ncbi:MAG: cold shock domain-containing protein [Cyanobacteria bacterium P01_C01_bin.38]
MAIDFGTIIEYYDKGFGYVGRTFSNSNKKVFFHITEIRRKHPELAQKLDNNEAFETVNFWYEVEINEKGKHKGKPNVSKLWLNAGNIPQSYTHELSGLTQKVQSIWKNLDSPKPSWLDLVTMQLVGIERSHELSVERDNLESQLKAAQEQRRMEETEALHENEIRKIANKYDLTKAEANELHQLLTQMRPLKFERSKQLSAYIVEHQLGCNYPNISGIVRMEEAGIEWDFHGGFPPDIYKIICRELYLNNQGTRARAVGFTPFESLLNKSTKGKF